MQGYLNARFNSIVLRKSERMKEWIEGRKYIQVIS